MRGMDDQMFPENHKKNERFNFFLDGFDMHVVFNYTYFVVWFFFVT